jgi:hypothetical protein
MEDIKEWWNSLNFSGKPCTEEQKEIDPKVFIHPPKRVQYLRELARNGRKADEEQKSRESGEKVVL